LDGDGDRVDGVTYLEGAAWNRQHGHHLYADGKLLLFNNSGDKVFGSSSLVLEIDINESGATAGETWRYDGGTNTNTLGDVQQMSNGNILVTYSNNGVIHEVDPSGSLVRSIEVFLLGYSNARSSLYGAPDRW
jgi:hypothetical protein